MRNFVSKIKKTDLIHGEYYKGTCRNATEARWDEKNQCFVYWRFKFGETFLETIKAPEDDKNFDVFVTEKIVEIPNKEIPLRDLPL